MDLNVRRKVVRNEVAECAIDTVAARVAAVRHQGHRPLRGRAMTIEMREAGVLVALR
jgi:hypothetical protein